MSIANDSETINSVWQAMLANFAKVLRNHTLILLSLAPFFEKFGGLIYDRFLIFFQEHTHKQTK